MNFIAGATAGSNFTNAGINMSLTPSTDSGGANADTMYGINVAFTAGSAANATVNAINVPTISAGSGTQYALNIGQNWTYGVNTLSPVLINSGRTSSGAGLTITESSLTSADALDITGSTAMTTGALINAGTATYVHTVNSNEIGSLVSLAFTDASTDANAVTTTTNGVNIASTVNTSGAGIKAINAVNVAAP